MKYFSVAKHSIMSWFKVITLGLVLGLGLQFVQAWTAPTATPPGGNVTGPITTSATNQTKTGAFRASNLSVNPTGALLDSQNISSSDAPGTLVLGTVGDFSNKTTQYGHVFGVFGANKVNTYVENVWDYLYVGCASSVCTAGVAGQVMTVNGILGTKGINTNGMTSYGSVTATSFITSSDRRFKKDIKSLDDVLAKVSLLQGVQYSFRTDEFPDKHFDGDNQIGFIAQDVEKVFPELVETDKDGYKSIDYGKVTPILVEAIKEQQIQIKKLEERLSILEAK